MESFSGACMPMAKTCGILVLVVPAKRIADCTVRLQGFSETYVFIGLRSPESVRYGPGCGVRSAPHETGNRPPAGCRNIQGQTWLASVEREIQEHSPLSLKPDHCTCAAQRPPCAWSTAGSLRPNRDLLPKSSAYRQASPVLFASRQTWLAAH